MLSVILVLLFAASALPAPMVLNQYSSNELQDNSLPSLALNMIDGGDTNVYILNIEQILREMASQPAGEARAYGQTIALLGFLGYGITGDSCAASQLINAYATNQNVRQALAYYIGRIIFNIDFLVQRADNPNIARNAISPTSGCPGQGREYSFEAVWQKTLNTAQVLPELIYEEYCVAKRMYYSVDAKTNVAGAIVTAASLEPSVHVFEKAAAPLADLLRALATGNNLPEAAFAAKRALIIAV